MYGDIGIGKCVNIYKNIKKYVTFFKYVSLNNVAKIYRKSIENIYRIDRKYMENILTYIYIYRTNI